MQTLLMLMIAGGVGGLIFTLMQQPERKAKERKLEIAKNRAIERFKSLSEESKQLLNREYTDEQILELYIFEELQKL
jgi:hypothetical protein